MNQLISVPITPVHRRIPVLILLILFTLLTIAFSSTTFGVSLGFKKFYKFGDARYTVAFYLVALFFEVYPLCQLCCRHSCWKQLKRVNVVCLCFHTLVHIGWVVMLYSVFSNYIGLLPCGSLACGLIVYSLLLNLFAEGEPITDAPQLISQPTPASFQPPYSPPPYLQPAARPTGEVPPLYALQRQEQKPSGELRGPYPNLNIP